MVLQEVSGVVVETTPVVASDKDELFNRDVIEEDVCLLRFNVGEVITATLV